MITEATRLYIYAFIWTQDKDLVLSQQWVGLDQAPIDAVTNEDLTLLVSATQHMKLRPQRKLLAAHQEIVSNVSRKWSALPVSFGLIADSGEHVMSLLERHHEALREQLRRVEGKVELSVTLRWKAENVFAYLLSQNPDFAKARDELSARRIDRDLQIEAGRLVERVFAEERARHTETVLNCIKLHCEEWEQQPIKQDQDVVRLACLVKHANIDALEKAVYTAAAEFNEDFEFSFNGPWPPYSFVKLALSME